jgi:hypothetical protein
MKKKGNNQSCSLSKKITLAKTLYSNESTNVYRYKMPNNKKKDPKSVYRKK